MLRLCVLVLCCGLAAATVNRSVAACSPASTLHGVNSGKRLVDDRFGPQKQLSVDDRA
jgi:hypothetical protein